MLELNREIGTALVLVTHDHRLAARADRMLELSGGTLDPAAARREGAERIEWGREPPPAAASRYSRLAREWRSAESESVAARKRRRMGKEPTAVRRARMSSAWPRALALLCGVLAVQALPALPPRWLDGALAVLALAAFAQPRLRLSAAF